MHLAVSDAPERSAGTSANGGPAAAPAGFYPPTIIEWDGEDNPRVRRHRCERCRWSRGAFLPGSAPENLPDVGPGGWGSCRNS
jgi:hypothetical protein